VTGQAFALFETAIGTCSVAWGEHGITGIGLPDRSIADTRTRLRAGHGGIPEADPPAHVARAIRGMASLLDGNPVDLSFIALDMTGVPSFPQRVYAVTRAIRAGSTMTYGEVARELGAPGSARAVGQALGRNPFPIVVPCHRVLAAGGRTGGFSATGGVGTKLRLLAIERADAQLALPR
jgi:methylated-DNA-[protein]-cysteine S-methyltransferase